MKKTLIIFALISVFSLMLSMTASAGPVMDRILKKGELVIGTSGTQPPMTATNKNGEIIGLDVDISKAMADAMGVKVKFVSIPFAELLPALESGQVDMVVSGMTIAPKRNRKVAFVGPYFVSGKGILAVGERYNALRQADGLNSPEVTVAALKDSTSQKFAETMMTKAKLILTKSYEESIDLLLKGKVDIVTADYPFCALTAYRYSGKGLVAGESPLTFEPLGIAMKEDTLLINWVQNFFNTLNGSGELKEMHQKWLKGGAWIDELP